MTAIRVREAIHQADVDLTGRPGPFILTACIGADGSVWAVLTDAAGGVVKTGQTTGNGVGRVVHVVYRSLDRNGRLWCETSDPAEVVRSSDDRGDGPYTFEQLTIRETNDGWQPWTPTGTETLL